MRRVSKTIRISPAGIAAVQQIANHYGCDWSEAARRMLAHAATGMPRTWENKPADPKNQKPSGR